MDKAVQFVCWSDTVGEVAQPAEAPVPVRQQLASGQGKTGLFTAVGTVNELAIPTSPTVSGHLTEWYGFNAPSARLCSDIAACHNKAI